MYTLGVPALAFLSRARGYGLFLVRTVSVPIRAAVLQWYVYQHMQLGDHMFYNDNRTLIVVVQSSAIPVTSQCVYRIMTEYIFAMELPSVYNGPKLRAKSWVSDRYH